MNMSLRRKETQTPATTAPAPTIDDVRRLIDGAQEHHEHELGRVKAHAAELEREVDFLREKLSEADRIRNYYHAEFVELRTLVIATIEECESKASRLRQALERSHINAENVRKNGSGQHVDIDSLAAQINALGAEDLGAKFGANNRPAEQ